MVVQVRAAADALYPSTLEPWSEWLTGTQGQAPSPPYDPLAFMVRETHRRAMEFHAWLNPYRALTNATTASVAPNHVTVLHPDWVVPYGTLRVLDPGLPAVRQYLVRVVMDVVRRYDIDAIHFDDYFYPAPQTGLTFNDDASFAADPRGFTVKADWRRSNIDIFVKTVSDSIRAVKPRVKFWDFAARRVAQRHQRGRHRHDGLSELHRHFCRFAQVAAPRLGRLPRPAGVLRHRPDRGQLRPHRALVEPAGEPRHGAPHLRGAGGLPRQPHRHGVGVPLAEPAAEPNSAVAPATQRVG